MGKDQESADYGVRKVPEFDRLSRNGQKCSLSDTGRIPPGVGRQSHEVDEFILRGPQIAHEGFFDFRPSVLRAIALEFTDLVPPGAEARAEEAEAKIFELTAELNELSAELDDAYRALGNATARFPDEEPEVEPELLPVDEEEE